MAQECGASGARIGLAAAGCGSRAARLHRSRTTRVRSAGRCRGIVSEGVLKSVCRMRGTCTIGGSGNLEDLLEIWTGVNTAIRLGLTLLALY